MTLDAGARLGHYRIVGLLGRGGMADVYRAEDERLGREVALKAVPPEFARDPERVERFEQEVRAAARLTHPNIVTVYEFGQGEGQHFYTMALMPGGDLKARIRAHPDGMPAAEARAVAAAMARALDYAHRQGFVHRDVKPENILFGEDGAPQLTDFGIARAMSSGARMTATGMSIGSPHYMSPEQARGKAVDGRSDLYSLGVVLYEMLTGRVPFDAGDTLAVAYAHVNDPAPDLPAKLASWQPMLGRLLSKSPDERYGSAGELAEILASDALPPAPARRVMPGRRDAGLAARSKKLATQSKQLATQLMSAPRAAGVTGQLRELVTRLVGAAQSRRGTPAAVAGGALLALAVVGIGYVALQDTDGPERQTSSGGGSGSAVRTADVRPAPARRARPAAERFPVPRAGAPAAGETTPSPADTPEPARPARAVPTSGPGRAESDLGLDRSARRLIQQGLAAAGFNSGPADGQFGPATREAIRLWQAARSVATTGYLDRTEADFLRGTGSSDAEEPAQRESAFWTSIAGSSDPANYETYLRDYGNGVYRELARNRAAELRTSLETQELSALLGREPSASRADENGWTDLHYAAILNLPHVVTHLSNAGARVSAGLNNDQAPIVGSLQSALRRKGHDLDGWTRDGETPLHLAAWVNASAAVERLIAHRAAVEAKTHFGWTPLHYAAFGKATEAMQALISGGANRQARNNDGETANDILNRVD